MVGSVMNYSGISEELMNMAEVLAGHMKGGLAQVNCLLSAMMGGISGSANADAAMESKILVPEMIKKVFQKNFQQQLQQPHLLLALLYHQNKLNSLCFNSKCTCW